MSGAGPDRSADPMDARFLWLALACAFASGVPWLFGHGVDVPDDALYFEVSSWEWFHYALRHGVNPFFQPGKLGGISLFADVVPMGPFYPALLSTLLLPAWIALPWACVLHDMGMFLAVRWLARVLGASSGAASLAGAAVAVGPLGAMGFVDCRAAGWAGLLWFPVAFGALERLRQSELPVLRWRWTAVAAMAFALVQLGSHVRFSAAAGAALTLWVLMSGLPLRHGLTVLVLGVLGGLPTVLPTLLEWRISAPGGTGLGERLASLAQGLPTEFGMTRMPGWLNPRPWPGFADYSLGAVLGAAFLLVLGRGPLRLRGEGAGPAGRIALWVALLMIAFYTQAVPGLRYLWAPLLLLTHPVSDCYAALALLPGAAVAALGLDWLSRQDRSALRALLKGPRGWLIAALVALSFAILLYRDTLPAERGLVFHGWGLLQVVLVLLGAGSVLLRGGPDAARRRRLLLVLALLDLALIGLRTQISTPSQVLPLRGRVPASLAEPLAGGYLDLNDLGRLEPLAYSPSTLAPQPEEDEDQEDWPEVARAVQAQMLDRQIPVHAASALGLRGLGGVAKMPPFREYKLLEPLMEATRQALEAGGPEGKQLAALFDGQQALGSRTLALHGIPLALGYDMEPQRVGGLAPRCYAASSVRQIEDVDERIRLLLSRPADPSQSALVEAAEGRALPPAAAEVSCAESGPIHVQAEGEALVVLRERWHPGWSVTLDGDRALDLFPVNQVQLGMWVPEGEHELEARFVPPGLPVAAGLGLLAWSLLIGIALWPVRGGGAEGAREVEVVGR